MDAEAQERLRAMSLYVAGCRAAMSDDERGASDRRDRALGGGGARRRADLAVRTMLLDSARAGAYARRVSRDDP
jgi:hypothetical protein